MRTNEHPDEAPNRRPPRLSTSDWRIYRGTGRPIHDIKWTELLPAPPPWRAFDGGPLPETDDIPADDGDALRRLGAESHVSERDVDPHEVDMVNAALYLRRPLLVTGPPGSGKSSLAYRIAQELGLGRVLRWPITSLAALKSGLYLFDAIGRAQSAGVRQAALTKLGVVDRSDFEEVLREPPIGEFVKLGPLGTAFLPRKLPRVLLIDELDKSEADLPNDLLSIFEHGEFVIPELERVRRYTRQVSVLTDDPSGAAVVSDGRVRCNAFPMVIATSNGEREFPPAFLRRCLRLEIGLPSAERLAKIVAGHLRLENGKLGQQLIREFVQLSKERGGLPTDKLLEAIYLATSGAYVEKDESWTRIRDALWRQLSSLAT